MGKISLKSDGGWGHLGRFPHELNAILIPPDNAESKNVERKNIEAKNVENINIEK